MAALSAQQRHHRARIAALSRDRHPDDPDLVGARRDKAVADLDAYVRRTLESAPPLTDDQVERIAGLLRAGGAA